MRSLLIALGILIFAFPTMADENERTLEGWGPLKFGMKFQEVMGILKSQGFNCKIDEVRKDKYISCDSIKINFEPGFEIYAAFDKNHKGLNNIGILKIPDDNNKTIELIRYFTISLIKKYGKLTYEIEHTTTKTLNDNVKDNYITTGIDILWMFKNASIHLSNKGGTKFSLIYKISEDIKDL